MADEQLDLPNEPLATLTNRYQRIIEHIFFSHYYDQATQVEFEREDIVRAARALDIKLPKNLGDVVYSFRYRTPLPESVRSKAPTGLEWAIVPAGTARYAFVAKFQAQIVPTPMLAETKLPDATPVIITMYAVGDEQALLAKVRYNRLIDIFTGVTCYSLQNHLRTTVPSMGQVETDEVYVGVDRRGAQYVFPVQAKGGADKLGVVQIEQDFALCAAKFPRLICRPIAAQFMADDVIALFAFEQGENGIGIIQENHYRLVPGHELSPNDLQMYRQRPVTD